MSKKYIVAQTKVQSMVELGGIGTSTVADWPRVPGCDRTLGPPPKKTGPPWSTDTIITHDE